MATKRNIIALILVAIICLPGFLFIGLRIWKEVVRFEMVEKLEHSNLQKLCIKKNEVRWYKKNREILVANRLFDVESWESKNDSIVFKGLFDDKETLIKNRVAQLLDQQNRQSTPNKVCITQLVFQVWYCISNTGELTAPFRVLRNVSKRWYIEKLTPVYSSILSPPPRFC